MTACPCCSDQLLRHVRDGSVYLFCRTCWAEMPGDAASLSDTLSLDQRIDQRTIVKKNGENPTMARSGTSHLLEPSSYSVA